MQRKLYSILHIVDTILFVIRLAPIDNALMFENIKALKELHSIDSVGEPDSILVQHLFKELRIITF